MHPPSKDLLHEHEDLPGVILSQLLKEARVTSRGKGICREEIGASLVIPRNSVAGEVKVGLAAGFSGSHDIPEGMEAVSPAYVVTADKSMELSKDMTLTMQHTVENTTDNGISGGRHPNFTITGPLYLEEEYESNGAQASLCSCEDQNVGLYYIQASKTQEKERRR